MSKQVIRMGNREYKKIEKKYRKANETIKSLKDKLEHEKGKINEIIKTVEMIDIAWDGMLKHLESKIKFERKLSLSVICILAGIIIILVK
jgi:flagellin-specific chaperone FliS